MFKKTIIAGLTAAALGAGLAPTYAADAAPPPEHTLTGNVGLYSQYIFRGLTQTNKEPAIQGGFDYAHSSGAYLGTWASNISWLRDGGSYMAGGSGEFDFYGGYKWGFANDFTLDVGGLYYYYPGDVAPGFVKADTFEIYTALSWKWLTGKFSYAVSDKVFGFADADGSYYLDLTATVPVVDKLNFIAHWGMQEFRGGTTFNNDLCSYKDWKLGLSYALPKDFTIGAFYTDTSNASGVCYGTAPEGGVFPRNIAKGTGTIFISKTF